MENLEFGGSFLELNTANFWSNGFGLSRQPIELCAIGPLAFSRVFFYLIQ